MICWTYAIKSRTLTDPTGRARVVGQGAAPPYSGNRQWRDDPASCGVVDHGPLPPGQYKIGILRDGGHLGPYVMDLTPDGWDGGGRSFLRIHGDNGAGDASASDGCLILDRADRLAIGASGVKTLVVVP